LKITQGVHRAAQIRPNALATVFGARRRSWSEFRDRVSRYAGGLKSLGLKRGDRVAIIAQNSDSYIETYYAVAWAGGVAVPGNFRWTEHEHIHALRESDARFLILDNACESLAANLSKACGFDVVLLMEAQAKKREDQLILIEDLIAGSPSIEDLCGQNNDLCVIFYTGGTTGRPKGVMLSHYNLISNILAVNAMTAFPPDPVFLHLPPMFHLADAGAVFTVTMYAGTHVVLPSFTPAAAVAAIEQERVTVALMVPTMFRMLLEYTHTWPADFSSVRRIRYGAAGISEQLLRDAMRLFPNAEFQQGYGQTELSPSATILEPRFHNSEGGISYLRSAGRPLLGTDVRIVDDAFVEKPRGEIGEIAVRGPGVMLGYWNQPDLTASTIVDGWVRTGDAGWMDGDGFLYIADRLKDMIVSGGENVFSAEVENALNSHAAVAECAVIGVPDEKWGERVHAVVRFKDGVSATTDQLIAHCSLTIARYKCPRTIEARTEPFPLSAQGKIIKSELRRSYWQNHHRQVG
jgi:long-chain acyl-CoA synthetase